MARSKQTYQAHSDGLPQTGIPKAVPRALNQRARNRKIECRWLPDVESNLGEATPVTAAELEAICQLLGDDFERLLQD